MPELLASDVIITEEAPTFAALPTLPTAVVGAVGVTKMGPVNETRLTTNFDEWVDIYGGFAASADLTMAAFGFYLQVGTGFFWGVRTVHYSPDATDQANKTSAAGLATLTTTGAATQGSVTSTNAEPFNLAPGDDLDIKVDGGGTQTATFDAAPATVTGSSGTYPTTFTGGETIILEMNNDGNTQTITFTSGAQTLAQVIDEINPQLQVGYADDNGGELRLTSDKAGTGSEIDITGGTALATLGLSTGTTNGTGDVIDVDAVTAAEVKTRVEDDTTAQVTVGSDGKVTIKTPTVGAGGSIQVEASSTADDEIGLDNSVHTGSAAGPGDMGKVHGLWDGAYVNTLDVVVAAASSGDSDEFNLSIKEGTATREVWVNMSTVLTSPRYWITVMNTSNEKSKLVYGEDLLTGTPPDNRPDNGTFSMSGGDDGLTSLADADFVGSSAGPTGLYLLDTVENLSLLIVPGRASATVHQTMLTYCETWRNGDVFAVLDPPAGQSATEIVTYVKTTAALKNLSEFGAIYWPRIRIGNPAEAIFTSDADGMITVAPSGFIAGVYARTDGETPGGIYQPPAGSERGNITGVTGYETDEVFDKRKRDIVYPELINPVCAGESDRWLDGTKTLLETGNWPQIQQRRGTSYMNRTVRIGLKFARHANNTRALRRRAHRTVRAFLAAQMALGAFETTDEATAFRVDFSDALNTATVRKGKLLRGRLGYNRPTSIDWVWVSVGPYSPELEAA